jgi:hypothetical protein
MVTICRPKTTSVETYIPSPEESYSLSISYTIPQSLLDFHQSPPTPTNHHLPSTHFTTYFEVLNHPLIPTLVLSQIGSSQNISKILIRRHLSLRGPCPPRFPSRFSSIWPSPTAKPCGRFFFWSVRFSIAILLRSYPRLHGHHLVAVVLVSESQRATWDDLVSVLQHHGDVL